MDFFEYFNHEMERHICATTQKCGLVCCYAQDLSFIWNSHSGAVKVATYPCYCCNTTSQKLVMPKHNLWYWCICTENTTCYHHQLFTEDLQIQHKQECMQLLVQDPYLTSISGHNCLCKLLYLWSNSRSLQC